MSPETEKFLLDISRRIEGMIEAQGRMVSIVSEVIKRVDVLEEKCEELLPTAAIRESAKEETCNSTP